MASDTGTRKRKQSPQKRSSRSASPAVVKKKLVKRGSVTEDERDDDKDTSLSKKTMMRKAVCKAAVTRDDDEEATPNGSQENIPYEDIVRQNNGTATIPVDDEHNTGQDKDTIQDAEDVERGEQIKPASQTTTQNDDEMQVDNDETNVENPKPDSTSTETSTTNRSDDSKNTVDAEAQQNDEDAQTAGSASKTPAANILSSAVKSAVRAEAQRTPSKSVKQHEIPKKDLIDNSDDGNIDGSPMKIRVSKFKKLDQSKAIQEALGANRDLAGEIESAHGPCFQSRTG